MAISKAEQYLLYDLSTQLLQQDVLTSMLFQGGAVGKSLRDMVLSSQNVEPLTNPYDEAITGSLRADARTTMQNSKNVSEAASMYGIAEEALSGIPDILKEMEAIVTDVATNGYTAAKRDNYNSLKAQIDEIIDNTSFNGISLLDSTKWGTPQIDANGNVYIQAYKNGGFNARFEAVDALGFSGLSGASLANAAGRTAQSTLLSNLKTSVNTISDMYESRETSLTSQADSLKAQSALLDQAVEARRQTPTMTEEEALLNLILTTVGSLLDQTS